MMYKLILEDEVLDSSRKLPKKSSDKICPKSLSSSR